MSADNAHDFNVEVDTVDRSRWSDILLQFDDATIYQTWSYASVIYGESNLSHVVLKDNDDVVAVAQVGIRHFRALQTATANVHWGPLWRKKNTTHSNRYFEGIVKALINEYGGRRHMLLRVWTFELQQIVIHFIQFTQ